MLHSAWKSDQVTTKMSFIPQKHSSSALIFWEGVAEGTAG